MNLILYVGALFWLEVVRRRSQANQDFSFISELFLRLGFFRLVQLVS